MSAGIDYGMGQTNIDPITKIRYGVIQANHVGQEWYDTAVADYGDPICPECGSDDLTPLEVGGHHCKCCDAVVTEECYPEEARSFSYEDSEYSMTQGDDGDIFVLKSPYYTLCKFASPCAPGAGYLEAQDEDGIFAYCLGVEWFEGGKAPYAIYQISDDACVYHAEEE